VRLGRIGDPPVYVDVHVSRTLYQGQEALLVLWLDSAHGSERQRQVEAEVMRDILAALAGAADMQQALEIILVNLHDLIHYDRVGLFLADESQRVLSPAGEGIGSGRSVGLASQDNPLVAEFQRTGKPIIVPDVQADSRFSSWAEMGAVRGWLGAPLLAGERVIGFLSMGSLKASAYTQADADLMAAFAARVAEVLEKAWTFEQSLRRSEQLEVLSNITFALGRAERQADTLSAIVAEITHFFGALKSAFLLADQAGSSLMVKVSPVDSLVGYHHPRGDDLVWQVYDARQTSVIMDTAAFLAGHPIEIYALMCAGAGSAALIPLIAADRSFGVLCLAFERPRRFSFDDIRLYDMVAEIAGSSLHRAVSLQTLERQVDIRTGHLSTLYEINAVAGEPLELDLALERMLEILLGAMRARAGAIHLLDSETQELVLSVQQGLPIDRLAALASFPLSQPGWRELLFAAEPLVAPDARALARLPEALRQSLPDNAPTFIGAPIRAEGRVWGLLSVFGADVLQDAIESLALLMTVADQVGGYIERAGLIQQAERAAVIEERQRLARELHDSVTQQLYSQVLFSGAGLKVIGQGDLSLAEEHLQRINQVALQALKEMRLLLYELRPDMHLDAGLVQALEHRLDSVERRSGIVARLEVGQGTLGLDQAAQAALYRIAEEALNNTLKHAEARSVTVKLGQQAGRFIMEVLDDGRGFDPELQGSRGGMGLENMRARAAELGAELLLASAPGQGARLTVVVDLEEQAL
jgi:signal transduction histidine kinase/putative methionine-R-sulfoxide reductase with GAF domain